MKENPKHLLLHKNENMCQVLLNRTFHRISHILFTRVRGCRMEWNLTMIVHIVLFPTSSLSSYIIPWCPTLHSFRTLRLLRRIMCRIKTQTGDVTWLRHKNRQRIKTDRKEDFRQLCWHLLVWFPSTFFSVFSTIILPQKTINYF